ncbi:helix-turn-helix domain-containing protein [Kitasatospora sp. MBT66]|uniref:helix-turn-helix domain-containing protein n=1 Tax=Kitasatospora sp. MBT66 TaxID=1444769 RepID=UPI0009EA610B|nr:helix-turn-helix domain-containing protein [Kitasatospora sp. MBT66]
MTERTVPYAHDDKIKAEALRLILEEGYSYQKAADQLGLSKNTVAAWVRNSKQNIAALVDYSGYLPHNLADTHSRHDMAVALRAIAEQDANISVTGRRSDFAESFRVMSGDHICHYDPELAFGFYWTRRKSGDEGWIVVD